MSKPYRTFAVQISLRWLVRAQSPEAAKQWAEWALHGMQMHMPCTDPHALGCIPLGPAGAPIITVVEDPDNDPTY